MCICFRVPRLDFLVSVVFLFLFLFISLRISCVTTILFPSGIGARGVPNVQDVYKRSLVALFCGKVVKLLESEVGCVGHVHTSRRTLY
jgi:hypothetical protein